MEGEWRLVARCPFIQRRNPAPRHFTCDVTPSAHDSSARTLIGSRGSPQASVRRWRGFSRRRDRSAAFESPIAAASQSWSAYGGSIGRRVRMRRALGVLASGTVSVCRCRLRVAHRGRFPELVGLREVGSASCPGTSSVVSPGRPARSISITAARRRRGLLSSVSRQRASGSGANDVYFGDQRSSPLRRTSASTRRANGWRILESIGARVMRNTFYVFTGISSDLTPAAGLFPISGAMEGE